MKRIQQKNKRAGWKIVVEFRHNSWYMPQAVDMLNDCNAAMVLHDMPGSASEFLLTQAAAVYIRFHGVKGDYRGSYDAVQLDKIALQVTGWITQGKDVYVYFNNTMGDAYRNAQDLFTVLQLHQLS